MSRFANNKKKWRHTGVDTEGSLIASVNDFGKKLDKIQSDIANQKEAISELKSVVAVLTNVITKDQPALPVPTITNAKPVEKKKKSPIPPKGNNSKDKTIDQKNQKSTNSRPINPYFDVLQTVQTTAPSLKVKKANHTKKSAAQAKTIDLRKSLDDPQPKPRKTSMKRIVKKHHRNTKKQLK